AVTQEPVAALHPTTVAPATRPFTTLRRPRSPTVIASPLDLRSRPACPGRPRRSTGSLAGHTDVQRVGPTLRRRGFALVLAPGCVVVARRTPLVHRDETGLDQLEPREEPPDLVTVTEHQGLVHRLVEVLAGLDIALGVDVARQVRDHQIAACRHARHHPLDQ